MVKLRLARMGKKKKPIYKLVAADSRSPRDGKFIEAVGQYNPNVHPIGIEIKELLLYKWLRNGAIPTDTVRSLLQRKGLWLKWNLMRKGTDEAAIALAMEQWQQGQAEKLAREVAKKLRRKAKRKLAAAPAVTEETPAAA